MLDDFKQHLKETDNLFVESAQQANPAITSQDVHKAMVIGSVVTVATWSCIIYTGYRILKGIGRKTRYPYS